MSDKEKKIIALDEQRARLERRANVIRSRLLRTIDALDTRRHQVEELGHHAKRMAKPLAASVVGIAVVTLGTTLAIRALVERRRERNFSYRLSKALAPFRQPPPRPMWRDILRTMTVTALGMVAREGARRGLDLLMKRLPTAGPIALLPPGPPAAAKGDGV